MYQKNAMNFDCVFRTEGTFVVYKRKSNGINASYDSIYTTMPAEE